MDLHDYEDVAENYDLYLEAMYKDVDAHAGFREFYLDFAREYGKDGVIDIACGTGAVLLDLAEHGIMADGTDLSEAMCRVADEKARRKGFALRIFPADMTLFRSDRKYSCAIIARSGFMHLPTQELQKAALRNLRNQLLPGGILTLNTFDPWPPMQAQQMSATPEDYSFRLEYINRAGNREQIYNAITYNPYTQQMYGHWKFVEFNEAGEVIGERIRPLLMRQTTRWEMFLLAENCGFEVQDIFRGYQGDKEDLSDPDSAARFRSNLIWILKRKD